jgi:hypothetical protein
VAFRAPFVASTSGGIGLHTQAPLRAVVRPHVASRDGGGDAERDAVALGKVPSAVLHRLVLPGHGAAPADGVDAVQGEDDADKAVACHADGTTRLPRARDHLRWVLGRDASIMMGGGGRVKVGSLFGAAG